MLMPVNCCKKPCLVVDWVKGVYGYKCTNCRRFTPSTPPKEN